MKPGKMFEDFASKTASWVGRPWAFLLASFLVIAWASSGPYFHFSDSWELVINTATTIVTFLMVFLIQNTQNRDAHALHLKLDELIYALKEADNNLIDIEHLSEDELDQLSTRYRDLIIRTQCAKNTKRRR